MKNSPKRRTKKASSISQRVDTIGAAKYLGVSNRTLTKWRYVGDGPPSLKLGRRVVYSLSDLEGWLNGRRRFSTSQH